ncbi:hypothetical protein Q5P01_010278 [Channa striata]|uniref:Uncharacterized protein n=1 Tax=Channa striata TaxID=64152 RepID=A0AA88MXI4_CHASR|nr:hypothetical protein Q5P01_010278 [Channa striata]
MWSELLSISFLHIDIKLHLQSSRQNKIKIYIGLERVLRSGPVLTQTGPSWTSEDFPTLPVKSNVFGIWKL